MFDILDSWRARNRPSLYLVASAIFRGLSVAALHYGDRQSFEPLMLFANGPIVIPPLRRSHR